MAGRLVGAVADVDDGGEALELPALAESIPRGRRHGVAPPRFTIFTNSSDWWRGKCSVRFLTIFLCGSGVGAMAMAAQRNRINGGG